MALQWNADDNSYCYLVLPLFLFLCWDKNKIYKNYNGKIFYHQKLEFERFYWNAWGLVPVFIAVLLFVFAEISAVESILYIGFFVCSFGILFVLYGNGIKHLFFPLIILLFIIPLPPFLSRILTFQLKLAASSFSTVLLRASGVSVFREGNIIDLGASQLLVVDACSGLRYLMPLLLLAMIVGYFFNKRLWKRVILCFAAIPLSIIVNAGRIWITGLLKVNGYDSLANSFFHNFSGIVVFLCAGAILVLIAILFKRKREGSKRWTQRIKTSGNYFQKEIPLSLSKAGHQCRSADLKVRGSFFRNLFKPALITTVLCLFFSSGGWALKRIPSGHRLPERRSFTSFPIEIGQWKGSRHDISENKLYGLWADDFISVIYRRQDSKNYISLFIPFYEYQSTRHTAHAPRACMLGGGWTLLSSRERQIQIKPNNTIRIATMTWRRGNYQILGGYFFLQRGRVITTPIKNKFYLMWDALTKRRTDGALVRVEMILAPGQSDGEAYDELKAFLVALWPILPDYVPG